MRPGRANFVRVLVAALCFCAGAAAPSLAQGRGGGGPPPGGGGPPGGGMGGGGMGGGGINQPGTPPPFGAPEPSRTRPDGTPTQPAQGSQPNQSAAHAGLQLGPPGRWWDDKSFAKSLKLRPDQQTRMDAIFEQNRDSLVSRHENLEQAESQMAEITRSPNPDEAALFTQIDRVAQANAELDKAYTHMLLQIRKEMDADQIARLEKRH